MTTERYNSRKVFDASNKTRMSGINTDNGPFVGIVKNNVDFTRSGRLDVYIPFMGGPDPENPIYWTTCSYASPFFGHTNMLEEKESTDYEKVKQSYGFWMVPPDLGVRVLVTFANGDPNLAFWFACIPEPYSHHMVPGIAARDESKINTDAASRELKQAIGADPKGQFPVTEGALRANGDVSNFYDAPKSRAVHEDVYKQLLAQGLEKDIVRGTISSSSQRETPSKVFGFSTPGRPLKDIAAFPNSEELVDSNADLTEYLSDGKKGRRSGHSLVMDDGDVVGRDILVRLRTSRGHQILMHDTEDLIYIGSANGKTWIELSPSGEVLIYAANSVSIRTQNDFNLHADGNINLNSGKNINIRAAEGLKTQASVTQVKSLGAINLHSSGDLTIKSEGSLALESAAASGITAGGAIDFKGSTIGLNSAAGPATTAIEEFQLTRYPDTALNGLHYDPNANSVDSINSVVPTHEPYTKHPDPKDNQQRAELINRLKTR